MTDPAEKVWHVIHKPTATTLCGQPNDGTRPAEGQACDPCATAMYDVFGEVLDELEAERAKVARVEAVVERMNETPWRTETAAYWHPVLLDALGKEAH